MPSHDDHLRDWLLTKLLTPAPDQVRREIEQRLGFFPPFFQPALAAPSVLADLWNQTQLAYLDNPLPALFKEKLAALLARDCTVPYCLMCHTASLHPLGLQAADVLDLLSQPEPTTAELSRDINALGLRQWNGWPQSGSPEEQAVLRCSVALFLQRDLHDCRAALRSWMPSDVYANLISFLSFNRVCLNWAEAHPELDPQADWRVQTHLPFLTAAQPALAELLQTRRSPAELQEGRASWLRSEHHRLLELEQSLQRQHEATLASLGEGILMVAAEHPHRLRSVNKPASLMLAASVAELVGQPVEALKLPPEALVSVLRTLQDQQDSYAYGLVLPQPDASSLIVNLEVTYFAHPRGELHSGALVVLHDVTAQHAAAEALQRAQSREGRAAAAAGLGFWEWDVQRERFAWNQELSRQLGLNTQVESTGLAGLMQHISPEDHAKLLGAIRASQRDRAPLDLHLRTRSESSAARWIRVRGAVEVDENDCVVALTGTTMDVTADVENTQRLTKLRDDAEAASLQKSTFLANMSHEIRTPLGAVLGFVEMMQMPDQSREDMLGYAAVIDRNSRQLLRIIDDILDLSKVEAGKLLIEVRPVHLQELVADVGNFLGLQAREKGLELRCEVAPDVPAVVATDSNRLRQILSNVIGNAIKFTSCGFVQLSVAASSEELIFRCRDTGVGILPEQANRLFQPFHQADESTSRVYGGTGLGLVLVRRLCQALGGSFHLEESTPGQGSTFVATIRLAPCQADTGTPEQAETLRLLPSGLRVLVVEDSPDQRKLIELCLQQAGCQPTLALDGLEGVEKATEHSFDAIVMDVQMPRLDGYKAARELRARGYRGTLVALTAHAMLDEKERCIQAGFSHFLTKPVQRAALLQLLASPHCDSNLPSAVGRGVTVALSTVEKLGLASLPGSVSGLANSLDRQTRTL